MFAWYAFVSLSYDTPCGRLSGAGACSSLSPPSATTSTGGGAVSESGPAVAEAIVGGTTPAQTPLPLFQQAGTMTPPTCRL